MASLAHMFVIFLLVALSALSLLFIVIALTLAYLFSRFKRIDEALPSYKWISYKEAQRLARSHRLLRAVIISRHSRGECQVRLAPHLSKETAGKLGHQAFGFDTIRFYEFYFTPEPPTRKRKRRKLLDVGKLFPDLVPRPVPI